MKKFNIKNYDKYFVPRFLVEYANYKLNEISENEYTNKHAELCATLIERALSARNRGLITVDECLRGLMNVLNTAIEITENGEII